MLIRFWGTRGSIPAPGPDTIRYGGNTTCIEVITDAGHRIIVDAGTGIRRLGSRIVADEREGSMHLFLTHCHWDHVQGLPFFEVLRTAGMELAMHVPSHLMEHADRILQTQLDPLFFPVSRADLQGRISIVAAAEPEQVHDASVSAAAVDHPGGALAYRIVPNNEAARSVILAPDSELTGDAGSGVSARLEKLMTGAKVLVHDAMYTEREYTERRGWGHSSHRAALELALRSEVQLLVLFHHHPDRTDAQVDEMLEECRAEAKSRSRDLLVLAAYEGLELEV